MNIYLCLVYCAVISSCYGTESTEITSDFKHEPTPVLQPSSSEILLNGSSHAIKATESSNSNSTEQISNGVMTSSASPMTSEKEHMMTTAVISPSSSSSPVASNSSNYSTFSPSSTPTVHSGESSSSASHSNTNSIHSSSSSLTHSVSSTLSVSASSLSHSITPSTTSQSLPVSTTPVPSTTRPPIHNHNVIISETNLLLISPRQLDKVFIELKGIPNQSLEGLYLTVRNASENANSGIIQVLALSGNLNDQGFYVLNNDKQLTSNLTGLESIAIALYSDESDAKSLTSRSLLNCLLLSTDPNHKVNDEVAEVYHPQKGYDLYVQFDKLNSSQDLSMSVCKEDTPSFVLSTATESKPNNCSLNFQQPFVLKLTPPASKKECPTYKAPINFHDLLAKEVVTKVNEFEQCGLAMLNIEGVKSETQCVDKKNEIFIKLHVKSALEKQEDCIKKGFENFIKEAGTVNLDNKEYLVANCSRLCFPNAVPSSRGGGDNKIKVTVGVVIACICVFLVILLIVIIYLKRNRRGVLQFRMTRLDEDDDDLVGDMDDFVGNQRATFSNFR